MSALIRGICRRHDRGQYAQACDQEAASHYGDKTTGPKAVIWSLRCYVVGFCQG